MNKSLWENKAPANSLAYRGDKRHHRGKKKKNMGTRGTCNHHAFRKPAKKVCLLSPEGSQGLLFRMLGWEMLAGGVSSG